MSEIPQVTAAYIAFEEARIRQSDAREELLLMIQSAEDFKADLDSQLEDVHASVQTALRLQRRTLGPWINNSTAGSKDLYHNRYIRSSRDTNVVWDRRAWLRRMHYGRHGKDSLGFSYSTTTHPDLPNGGRLVTLSYHGLDGTRKTVILEAVGAPQEDWFAKADQVLVDEGWVLTDES